MVLIIKDVCLVLGVRVDVPNKNQRESIQRRRYHGPKKKNVDDDNNNNTTDKKVVVNMVDDVVEVNMVDDVVDVNMVDDAADKNKVEGYRLHDMGILAELVKVCYALYVVTAGHMSVMIRRKGRDCHLTLKIKCTCGYSRNEFSSPTITKRVERD